MPIYAIPTVTLRVRLICLLFLKINRFIKISWMHQNKPRKRYTEIKPDQYLNSIITGFGSRVSAMVFRFRASSMLRMREITTWYGWRSSPSCASIVTYFCLPAYFWKTGFQITPECRKFKHCWAHLIVAKFLLIDFRIPRVLLTREITKI